MNIPSPAKVLSKVPFSLYLTTIKCSVAAPAASILLSDCTTIASAPPPDVTEPKWLSTTPLLPKVESKNEGCACTDKVQVRIKIRVQVQKKLQSFFIRCKLFSKVTGKI